ncbi:hypothetical protein SPHINGO391_240003 [Sphingomonas aurantiaca]|uniref:Uncharacterized protein n=1 Tax=Sphingomonas aurantiaca TaxID=185949 RepID=A0A5E7XZ60_9SPHN|nr:hypothetical protein SPHINGO391_240003 [Sphingomonas aurantiaca]
MCLYATFVHGIAADASLSVYSAHSVALACGQKQGNIRLSCEKTSLL